MLHAPYTALHQCPRTTRFRAKSGVRGHTSLEMPMHRGLRCTLQCCMLHTLHCTSVHAPRDSVQSRVCVDRPHFRCACTVCSVAHCNVACTIHCIAPVSTHHEIPCKVGCAWTHLT